jgi:hypothetical protein
MGDLKADPATTGMAGQLLHGLFDIGSSAILFTPAGAAVMEGYTKQQELIDKGVTPGTATAAGAVTGAAFFAGIKAPMTMGAAAVGRGIQGVAANVAVGSGVNLSAGIAERGFTHDLLERAGYKDMAAQYQAYDKQSLWTEAILGAVLSGGAGVIEARSAAKQSALDAALTVNSALHASRGTALGAPINVKSAAAHQSSLEDAVDQAIRGEKINVADSITEAEFLRPVPTSVESPISSAIREVYRDDLPAGERHVASDRLAQVPIEQRRALRFDAPELNEFAASIEQKYGLPGGLINALKNAGEKSGSNATSPKGARGVMQFMPENLKKYGVTDASDPMQIIDAAGRYLRDTSKQYGGNIDAMIADYNGGPRQAKRVMNGAAPAAAETQAYLGRVREYLGRDMPSARQVKEPIPETIKAGRDLEAPSERVDIASGVRLDESAHARLADTFGVRTDTEIQPIPRLTGEALSGKTYPDLEAMHDQALEHNAAVDLQGIGKFWGEAQAKEAAGWNKRTREKWLQEHETDESSAWLQERYINDELIREHLHAANNFDPTDAQALGRSIGVLSRKVDESGFFNTPEGNTFSNALRHAKEQGWNLDDVMRGMGERASEWARTNAPELFARLFDRASKPARPAELTGAHPETKPLNTETKATKNASVQPPGASKPSGEGEAASSPMDAQARGNQAVETARLSSEPARSMEPPELASARAIAGELGDMRIALDDGTEMTAREALAQADDAILQARDDSRAFEAAINCYLRKGS